MSDYIQTFGIGGYGGLDDRHKRRGKKQPLGFAPPKPVKRKTKDKRTRSTKR